MLLWNIANRSEICLKTSFGYLGIFLIVAVGAYAETVGIHYIQILCDQQILRNQENLF